MDITLSSDSNEEEVIKFFINKAQITEEIQNNLKKENITGDILPYLSDDEFKKIIGFKLLPIKKWKKYFQDNADKFKQKEIEEKITEDSSEEEVKNFFEKCLDFREPLNGMDGKQLIELDEEKMKKIGLNLGKRKRLCQYINHFKSFLHTETFNEDDEKIMITGTSSLEEVSNFLKLRLKFSQESIDEIQLDGETLFALEDNEIEDFNISTEEKEKLKNCIKRLKSFEETQKIIITKNTSSEEVADFLRKAFQIPENIIQDLQLDGEIFFTTTEDEINDLQITETQKKSWINYLKKYKPVNAESSKEDVKRFLKNNLSFSDISLQLINLDGKELLSQKEFQIKNLNISEEEKKRLLSYLKKDEIKLTNENDEKSISRFLDDKFGLSIKNFNEEDLQRISKELKEEEKNLLKKYLSSKNSIPLKREKIKQFHTFLNYKISPLTKNDNYNIIFFFSIKEYELNDFCFALYEEFESDYYVNYEPRFINDYSFENTLGEKSKIMLIQIQSNEPFNKLKINLKDYRGDNNSEIKMEYKIKCYYHFDNLAYDSFNNFDELKLYHIFYFYSHMLFDKKKNIDKSYKICFLNQFFNFIDARNETILYAKVFLSIFKISLQLSINPRNIKSIRIRELDLNRKIELAPEEYITAEEIENLNLGEQKSKFCELVVSIYANSDQKQIFKLIKSKNGKDYCSKVLELINKKKLNAFDFITIKDQKVIDTLQLNFLSVSKKKDDINFILTMSNGLLDNLKFILNHYNEIYKILDQEHNFFVSSLYNYNYNLDLLLPDEKSDINDIKINLSNIIKLTKDNKKKPIIDYNKLFEELMAFYSGKSLNELCLLYNIMVVALSDINEKIIQLYYEKIHFKGLSLMRKKEMKIQEKINFIVAQDRYYFDEKFRKSEKRDPRIFDYISLTDENNLKLIKENRIMNLFSGLNPDNENKLYQVVLSQMKKFKDLKIIFELFPKTAINKKFVKQINDKIQNIIFKALDEKKEEIVFSIFDNWLIVNDYNSNDLNEITKFIEMNYDLTSKYYKNLLENQKMSYVLEKIKKSISNFIINQYNDKKLNANSIISMLLISKDKKIISHFLNELEKNILTENDFYQKEENLNYQLFKLFLEKCSQLIKNKDLYDGQYLIKTIEIQSKIHNDIISNNVEYEKINNIMISKKKDEFLNRIKVIIQDDNEAKTAYSNLLSNYDKCKKKFKEFNKIEDFYNTFYNESKKKLIEKIKDRIKQCKEKKISEILKINNLLSDVKEFNYEQEKEEAKNLKYKNSCFFMAIYLEIDKNDKTEEKIFQESLADFRKIITEIINQKESKIPFFQIENVEKILDQVKNPKNTKDILDKEINFIEAEFSDLKKEKYIRQNLLKDLKNFSSKYKILKLFKGIITFIQSFNVLYPIKQTEFLDHIKETFALLSSNTVNSGQITKAIAYLKNFQCDVEKESSIVIFYELIIDKEESINFIKKIKDDNFEIRNLNDFIDENASELQVSDIENLLYVYSFYHRIIENKKITSDKTLIEIFNEEYNKDKNIAIHMQDYLKTYGEIIQMYDSFNNNSESAIQMVEKLLKNSSLNLFKDKLTNLFTYTINKKNINDLEELRNKILMTNANKTKQEKDGDKEKDKDKAQITNEYKNLIDNIKQLNKTLNNLIKSGYPDLQNLSLQIEDSQAKDKTNNKNLEKMIEEYIDINKNFQKSIKEGYEKYPLLRLFYGEQFIKINESIKDSNNINDSVLHLINSVALNMINDVKIDFKYQPDNNVFENINSYLMKLFEKNNVNLEEIYKKNQILDNIELEPGLYRKIKYGDNNNLINNIIDIYLNMTNNLPIINTLLICNEETTIQKIKSFLYKALFNDKPTLFLISNMEFLDLATTRKLVRTLKKILKILKVKNKKINSFLLFIYEKRDSGLVRDLEKIIPERNILQEKYMKRPEKFIDVFNKNELYCSKFSGYGKTTEIKYKVKSMGENAKYIYFPLGGSFDRKYIIDNLMKHKIDSRNGNSTYLHLDLSDTDNKDLMSEILFKLIILRYLDSNEKFYYLGYDVNIIIEIPNGFAKFDQKYKLLNLIKKVNIDELKPLRLEENAKIIRDSPISIVAEVLTLYDNKSIETNNINLDGEIKMSAGECEQIINKYFKSKNGNYYQKMNFIKILSNQFKSFTENPYFFYENNSLIKDVIKKSRYTIITNFIKLTTIFTQSPFDSILTMDNKSKEVMGDYNDVRAVEDGIAKLADEKMKQEIFSFKKIEPSLVFFNLDKITYSIITNNDKSKDDYKDLKLLFNSQNVDLFKFDKKNINKIKDIISYKNIENLKDLIDYKNMTHEGFLAEIKKVFDLDSMSIEDLKKLCEDLGNYIFVSDNFIKMVRILLNIEAKIPVILMGETGVGKTKLLEMLVRLKGKGKANWKKLEIHAGIKDKDIIDFIKRVDKEVEKEGNKDEKIWIFFDEINTCNSLGLITEIMCNHTYLGEKINENYVFLGACNPYRVLEKTMKESGLVYYNVKERNKLNDLVYTVNPLPYSLLNFIFDFGSLQAEDEKKYIINTVRSIISKLKREKIIEKINDKELENLIKEIFESICISHDFIRKKYDRSSVSLREIRRFGIFFEYFIKYFKSANTGKNKHGMFSIMKSSLNMSIYLCYYLRINDKSYRNELAQELSKIFKNEHNLAGNFISFPENEIKNLTKEMEIDEGIALNRALKENLYTCYTCIEANIPLIIVGKPGTGKSLSFNILYNTLKGENSKKVIFRDKGKLYRHYYQGSQTSTSEGILKVFEKARKDKKK